MLRFFESGTYGLRTVLSGRDNGLGGPSGCWPSIPLGGGPGKSSRHHLSQQPEKAPPPCASKRLPGSVQLAGAVSSGFTEPRVTLTPWAVPSHCPPADRGNSSAETWPLSVVARGLAVTCAHSGQAYRLVRPAGRAAADLPWRLFEVVNPYMVCIYKRAVERNVAVLSINM